LKISSSTSELLHHLQTLARVASTRSAIQALSGVRIVAEESGIELQATDTELSIRVPLTGTVERPGSVVLPARLLLEVVRQLGAPEVSLELRSEEQDNGIDVQTMLEEGLELPSPQQADEAQADVFASRYSERHG